MSDSPTRSFSTLDRMIAFVSPEAGVSRMMARERLRHFAATRSGGRARGRAASIYDQGSSESWKKQRERVDAMMEAREMEEVFCIVAGIMQKLGLYIVGQLEYQPTTGKDEINEQYDAYFHEWCGRADYAGRHRLRQLVQMGLCAAFRDGEHGWVEHIEDGELRLQAIEGDRIGGPHQTQTSEDNINGIVIDEKGRVKHYELYKRTRTTQYTKEGEVKPDSFIHLFFPNRVDQYHGVSKLAPALPHARDLYELLGSEKIAAKFAASWSAILRTKDLGAAGAAEWEDNPAGKDHPAIMRAQPGSIMKIEQGVEDFEFAPGVNRPNAAFMSLVETLIREIALALNLPYGFVYNMASFGGVTARLETQSAQRTFRWYQEQLETIVLNRVRDKVIMLGIAAKKIPWTKNWNSGFWRYGATLTGDVGHQTQADLDLIGHGIKTRSQLAAEYNNDFRKVMDQKGDEISIAMKVSKAKGVPLELLLTDLPNPTALVAAMERAKSGAPDPEAAAVPPGLIGVVGDKGVKGLVDVIMAVNRGEMDRESGVNTAMTVYGMAFLDADALFPKVGKVE